MKKTIQKAIYKLLDHPRITLFTLALVTVIFGSFLKDLRLEFSIEQLFTQDDPRVERFLQFRDEFSGVDNILFLIYESNDPFSKENLDKNRQEDRYQSLSLPDYNETRTRWEWFGCPAA